MRLLVIRTSAMGDVALTLPALRAVIQQSPDIEIVMLTRPSFKPFFNSIERLKVFEADFNQKYRGFGGIIRLFIDLSVTGRFDHIIDLHDVLRSRILRFLFRLKGVSCTVIDKGRKEKHLLVTGKNRQKLRHSIERYFDTFRKAGIIAQPVTGPWINPSGDLLRRGILAEDSLTSNIGVAPYAKHSLKMWPEDYMVALLAMISENFRVRIIFLGGKEEAEKLDALTLKVPGSVSIAGRMGLDAELTLIRRLDLVIAMDSSNMHIAALSGVNVVSIWGGTDPVIGFGAWMQPEKHSVRIPFDRLSCRPCTIYGKGKCSRGDLACLRWLTPDMVYNNIAGLKILRQNK